MATSMNDFFNFTSKVLPTEFNGEASKLQSFLDSLDLLQINATGNEENAILLIKTRLTGKARSLITTKNSIIEIENKIKSGIRVDSPFLLLAKLNKVRQNGKDITQYATEIDKLAEKLQAAYVSEGMPERLAEKYTK